MKFCMGNFQDERVKDLLRIHLEGMRTNSPPGQVSALDWSDLQRPEIGFYTLWDGEDLLGCGALKQLNEAHGEVKSMRTHPKRLRRGAGERILIHLLAVARERGYRRVSLETGSGPAFEPALALYRKHGFCDGHSFGNYAATAFNRFLHIDFK